MGRWSTPRLGPLLFYIGPSLLIVAFFLSCPVAPLQPVHRTSCVEDLIYITDDQQKMFDVPPEVRATWPPPNFVDPVTRGPSLIVIVIFSIIFTILVVALRCYTRLRITGTFGPDDILIAVAIVSTITSERIVCSMIHIRYPRSD